MARSFQHPTSEVLHQIAISEHVETIGTEDVWGGVHRLLGQITRDGLSRRYASILDHAGVTVDEFPDGFFWIVNEDCNGYVAAFSYPDAGAFESTVADYKSRWAASCVSR